MSSPDDQSFLAMFIECEHCGEIFRGPSTTTIMAGYHKHVADAHPNAKQ